MITFEEQTFSATNVPAFEAENSYEKCHFQHIDFTGHNLTSTRFIDCTFSHCKLANQKIPNTVWVNTTFDTCDLLGINWCAIKRGDGFNFLSCRLDFGVFQERNLARARLTHCSAVEADFTDANLQYADVSGTNFTQATFNNTLLSGADFRHSTGYVFDLRKTKIHQTQFSLPEAANLLTALGAKVEFI